MKIEKLLIAGGLFVAALLAPRAASAEYICGTSYRSTTSSGFGSDGYVSVSVYAGKDCTGAYIGSYWLCSTGATSTACATSPNRYERFGLLATYQTLLDALHNNTRVYVSPAPCNGTGAYNCASIINYWAD